jgi:hypothetical protein
MKTIRRDVAVLLAVWMSLSLVALATTLLPASSNARSVSGRLR